MKNPKNMIRASMSKAVVASLIFVFACTFQVNAQSVISQNEKVQTNEFEHTLPIVNRRALKTNNEVRPVMIKKPLKAMQLNLAKDQDLRAKLIEINKTLVKNGTNHTATITNVNGKRYIEYVPSPKQTTMSPQKETIETNSKAKN